MPLRECTCKREAAVLLAIFMEGIGDKRGKYQKEFRLRLYAAAHERQ